MTTGINPIAMQIKPKMAEDGPKNIQINPSPMINKTNKPPAMSWKFVCCVYFRKSLFIIKS